MKFFFRTLFFLLISGLFFATAGFCEETTPKAVETPSKIPKHSALAATVFESEHSANPLSLPENESEPVN